MFLISVAKRADLILPLTAHSKITPFSYVQSTTSHGATYQQLSTIISSQTRWGNHVLNYTRLRLDERICLWFQRQREDIQFFLSSSQQHKPILLCSGHSYQYSNVSTTLLCHRFSNKIEFVAAHFWKCGIWYVSIMSRIEFLSTINYTQSVGWYVYWP